MKKWRFMVLLSLVVMLFSVGSVYAFGFAEPAGETNNPAELIKEKRFLIREHQKANDRIEKRIGKKMEQLEPLIVELYESNIASHDVIDARLKPRMDNVMEHLSRIGELDLTIWKHLKSANSLIKAKNYNPALRQMNAAIDGLELKHEMLSKFDTIVDDFMAYLKSMQYK